MQTNQIRFHKVTFSYESARIPLFNSLSLNLGPGWTGVVGPNGGGKSTLLLLATGGLSPDSGNINGWRDAIYCPQRTDNLEANESSFLNSQDGEAHRWRGMLRIEEEWGDRWASLSHGERKRIQIAAALWRDPPALAVDEPTNHLDGEAGNLVAAALRRYEGIGLLVSHDRKLLDSLCSNSLFVTGATIELRRGNYSQASVQRKRESIQARREFEEQREEVKRLHREASKRRESAAEQQRRRSKKGLALKDHDARFKKNIARITGKDGVGGKLLRQMEGRIFQAEEHLDDLKTDRREISGIWLQGERSGRDALVRLPAGEISLGGERGLRIPDLLVIGSGRIGLTGPNGSGKSTLIRLVVGELDLPPERYVYIPQEIQAEEGASILLQAKSLSSLDLGRVMAVIRRLGSSPERLLDSREPSPGETRKLLLAIGIARIPYVIIMDEPTNHMDLPSIEHLEEALGDLPCAMVLVSHDEPFLDRVTQIRWDIRSETGECPCVLNIR